MMLFGGGPPPVTYVGVANIQYTSTSNSYFGLGAAVDSTGKMFCLGMNQTQAIMAVSRVNANGTLAGTLTIGPTASTTSIITQNGKTICCDNSGNHYILFSVSVNSTGFRSTYLIKYDNAGTQQWQRNITQTANNLSSVNICLDSTFANVIVTCNGTIGANVGCFVLSYTAAGALTWQRQISGSTNTAAYTVFTDASNNVFVGGQSNITGTFQGFIIKYNSAGTIQWQRNIQNGASQQSITSGAADTAGNLYLAGSSCLMKLPAAGTSFTWQNDTPTFNTHTPNYIDVNKTTGDIVGFNFNGSTRSYVSRWTTSGTPSWVNDLQAQLNGNGIALSYNETSNYIAWAGLGGNTLTAFFFRLPGDGSRVPTTQTFSLVIGGQSTYFYNQNTPVSASATSRTNTAGSFTDAAGTCTSSTSTISSTVTTNTDIATF
jgi:hypothetical protein